MQQEFKKHPGKVLSGIVVSDKMKDTVVVEVSRYTKHPKYGKYISTQKRYKAHNPGNTVKTGTKVFIGETRPLSKDKRFTVLGEATAASKQEEIK